MRTRGRAGTGWALLLAALLGGLGGLAEVGDAAVVGQPTRERAAAFADAVSLRAADVPGFTGTASRTTPGERRFREKVARCAGGADPRRALVRVDSPDFSRPSSSATAEQDANSTVTVMPSSRLVALDLAAIRSPRGQACLVRAVDHQLRAMKIPDVSFGRVSVATGRPPAPAGSVALHFRVTASAHGRTIRFYLDTLGFKLGPAEVGLTTLGIGQPFPPADEQRLFLLLLGRARANPL